MIGGGIGATAVIVGGILFKIYRAINHKKITISCCGKQMSASIDIDPLDSAEQGQQPEKQGEINEGSEIVKGHHIRNASVSPSEIPGDSRH